MSFIIEPYTPALKAEWDAAVRSSRNGTFLLERDYMDYHRDRFDDHSLVVRDDRGHIATLFAAATPSGVCDGVVTAHPGLTYGGLILPMGARGAEVLEIMTQIKQYLAAQGFSELIYRPVPHIFHKYPCEEDIYALWRLGAQMECCQLSAAIENNTGDVIKPVHSENTRRLIAKGVRNGISVQESTDYATFHAMLCANLAQRHNATPVHSLAEVELLAGRFPDNIKLWNAVDCDNGICASVLLYITETCAHCQYICSTPQGRSEGALPVLLSTLGSRYSHLRYFDFGTSNENHGQYLNEGLLRQKNGFGARGIVYPSFSLPL